MSGSNAPSSFTFIPFAVSGCQVPLFEDTCSPFDEEAQSARRFDLNTFSSRSNGRLGRLGQVEHPCLDPV